MSTLGEGWGVKERFQSEKACIYNVVFILEGCNFYMIYLLTRLQFWELAIIVKFMVLGVCSSFFTFRGYNYYTIVCSLERLQFLNTFNFLST